MQVQILDYFRNHMISTVVAHLRYSYHFTNVISMAVFILFSYCNVNSTVIDKLRKSYVMVIFILFSYCNMIWTVIGHFRQSNRFTNVNVKAIFILFLFWNMISKVIACFKQSYHFTYVIVMVIFILFSYCNMTLTEKLILDSPTVLLKLLLYLFPYYFHIAIWFQQ